MSSNHHQKVVLITGASSGIGQATAQRLAREGHHVVLGARREDRLAAIARVIQDAGGSVDARRLDVTDREDVAAFVDRVARERGRVDVIVNNAGVMPLSRMDSLLVKEWDQMIDVNVRGLLHGIAATLSALPTAEQRALRHRRLHRGPPGVPDRGGLLRHQVRRLGDH